MGRILIQIQHLLKLNFTFPSVAAVIVPNSNTTLVKVKLVQVYDGSEKEPNSNTTLVKVKSPAFSQTFLSVIYSNTTLVKVKYQFAG